MPIDRPWLTEPKGTVFVASGYPCILHRGMLGIWCGYVGVPAQHPWYGLKSSARVAPLHDGLSETAAPVDLLLEGLRSAAPGEEDTLSLSLAVHVHGGVTLAAPGDPPFGPDTWCFGFDCGHAGDLCPEMAEDIQARLLQIDPNIVYRDIDYATGETLRLAAQLKLVERRGTR